jgi:predicted nucleic acid-binding protein
MKGVEIFFDSNIIVYFSTNTDKTKQGVASTLIDNAFERGHAGISAQVMQECINVLGGKYKVPPAILDDYISNVLRPLYRVDTTAELIDSAVEIKRQWKYSFYDSLIIAGALACDAKTLYSEDLQHGQRIESLTIINPFI